MEENTKTNESKFYEKDFERIKRLIIIEKMIKTIALSIVTFMFFFLLINKTFIFNFFTNNFENYIDYLDFAYKFLSLENIFSDILDMDFLIPIINISIPKMISLVFLLIIYILSLKNIISKNYNYINYTKKATKDNSDKKIQIKNPIYLGLKLILGIFWTIFKIVFFYIMTLLILIGIVLLIFNFIVPYFDWFIDFAGGIASGIFLGIFLPIIGLGMIVSFFSGEYSGNDGKQRSTTIIYDKDGNIDQTATEVRQYWENKHIYNKNEK